MGPGLTRIFFLFGKSSQNSSKPELYFGVVYYVYSVCIIYMTLLKCVSYELSVMSMSVMGLKKVWMGVGGRGEFYPVFLTLQNPLVRNETLNTKSNALST